MVMRRYTPRTVKKFLVSSFIVFTFIFMLPAINAQAEFINDLTKPVSTQVGEINKRITVILQKYMFDGNDSLTRRDMSVEINNYLEGIKTLANYDVISDKSNNSPDIIFKKIVRVDVYLVFQGWNKPIVLNYEVGSSGVYETTLLRDTDK